MKFFKHFTDAHRGQSIQRLKDRHGMKGVGIYWTLVELCAEKLIKDDAEEFTVEHCNFTFHHRYIRDTLETHQLKNLLMYLRSMSDVGLMSFECIDDVIVISMPKLLECMDRDAKRARTKRAASAPKKKNKDKEEDKEKEEDICSEPSNLVPIKPPSSNALISISSNQQVAISTDLIKSWADTYPKEFLDIEVKKARSWIIANPHKAPKKSWGRFFNSWFDRGWEKYRTTLKSNPSAISVDDLNDLLGAS